jgi:hypothetical protein
VQELTGLRQVVLAGHLPDGSEFRQRILAREDFVATRSEPVSARKDYSRPWWRRMLGR